MAAKPVDTEFLNGIVDGDIEFQKELFSIFVENAQRNLDKLSDALKNKDNNAWYMAAHAFKGTAASIGAFDLSKNLERAQKNPEDNDKNKQAIIDEVSKELKEVLAFIDTELKK